MEREMKEASVLVADDHPIFREGLKTIIDNQPEYQVIGEASDGYRAAEMVRQHRPDFVVIDIVMPRMDGILEVDPENGTVA
jgi:YesN/AraC family two-component response regulator